MIASAAIVLIEDDEGHARLIEKNFRRSGVSNPLRRFVDGTSALSYLLRDEPGAAVDETAVIVLDLNLPDMSGVEILKQIKSHETVRRTPVIVLTTTDDKLEIQRCYESGCNIYLTKPLVDQSFATVIRHLGQFLTMVQVPETLLS